MPSRRSHRTASAGWRSCVHFSRVKSAKQQRRAGLIAEVARLDGSRLDAVRGALAELPDAAPAIARASMGDVLEDPNFLELQRFCEIVARIDELLDGAPLPAILDDAVRAVGTALYAGRSEKMGFYLADAFDPESGERAHAADDRAGRSRLRARPRDRTRRAQASRATISAMSSS